MCRPYFDDKIPFSERERHGPRFCSVICCWLASRVPTGRCAITRICCWTWNPIPWRARRRRWTKWLPPLASFLSWTGCCRAFRYGDGGWRCLSSLSPSRLGALFSFLFNIVVHVFRSELVGPVSRPRSWQARRRGDRVMKKVIHGHGETRAYARDRAHTHTCTQLDLRMSSP